MLGSLGNPHESLEVHPSVHPYCLSNFGGSHAPMPTLSPSCYTDNRYRLSRLRSLCIARFSAESIQFSLGEREREGERVVPLRPRSNL